MHFALAGNGDLKSSVLILKIYWIPDNTISFITLKINHKTERMNECVIE